MAAQFSRLLSSAHATQGFLFAPGTKKNIKSHLKQFALFCVYFNRQIIPAQRETLVAFFELFSVKFISYSKFTSRLKELLDIAGYNPALYSGHSMRRGGATLLFQLGCDPLVIQAVGDWRSDQFLKYCGLSLEQRLFAQRLMCSRTNDAGELGV